MNRNERINIVRTRRRADHLLCASFMAQSEPWLTLGLDRAACIKSVTGPLRDVYAAVKTRVP